MEEQETEKKPSLLKRYNLWVQSWSKRKDAERALGAFAFAESSFFPIPIDPLLITLILSQPKKTWRFVNISAVTSVLGGLLGYAVGFYLMQSVGQWVVDTYDLQEGFDTLGENYQDNAFLAVITAAMTPVPYKLITISAGAFKISLVSFIFASIIGRYARYALVGWFSRYMGRRYKDQIEYMINLVGLGLLALIVLAVVAFQFA